MAGTLLTELEDGELVQNTLAGDLRAFDVLVDRYSGRIYRFVLHTLGSREDAEDVQQETFVCAYRSLKRFRGDSSVGTWLYAIAARLCQSRTRKWLRRRSKEQAQRVDCLEPWLDGDPEEQLLAVERKTLAQKVLAGMSPPDRLLIVLRFVEGQGHDEIASILGCSVESSRTRLARAKKLFRERYERME